MMGRKRRGREDSGSKNGKEEREKLERMRRKREVNERRGGEWKEQNEGEREEQVEERRRRVSIRGQCSSGLCCLMGPLVPIFSSLTGHMRRQDNLITKLNKADRERK